MRAHIAGVENAGVENSRVDRRGGKCNNNNNNNNNNKDSVT